MNNSDEAKIFNELIRIGYFDSNDETLEANYIWLNIYVSDYGYNEARRMILNREC